MHTGLDASYRALDADQARAYRLLGLHPGPDFTTGLAAEILDTPPDRARALLGQLGDARLVAPAGQDRYWFRDPVREHARAQAARQEAARARRAVTGRIAGWYLQNAAEAERLLQPYRHGLRRDALPPPGQPPEVTGSGALLWLHQERFNLVAVVHAAARDRYPAAAWQLADAMWPLWLYLGHYRDQLQVSRAGLAAARRCGDRDGQARMLDRIGLAERHLGHLDQATASFTRAHALWRDLGSTGKATGITRKLGWIADDRGDPDEAIAWYRQALQDYHDAGLGSSRQAALTLIDLGTALTRAGQGEDAVTVLQEAARLLAAEPDPYNQARARAALGAAHAAQPDQAIPLLRDALETMTGLGVVPARAGVLETLAQITARAGDVAAARGYYQQALALLPPGQPREIAVRRALAALPGPGDSQ